MCNDIILKCNNIKVDLQNEIGISHVLRGIDLELYRGKTTAIIGESGSGKSMLAKTITRLLPENANIIGDNILYYDENKVLDLLDFDIEDFRCSINGKKVSIVFQDSMNALDPLVTIGNQIIQCVMQHLNISKKEAERKALEILNMVQIKDVKKIMKFYPHQLSGGMKQRVAIALALSCNPKILICDEPTTALDSITKEKILNLIKNIQKNNDLTVLIISHDLSVASDFAEYIYIMYAGKIIEKGKAEEIFYEPKHPYTWGLILSIPDDSNISQKLYSIPGNPYDLTQEVVGDAFADRNIYALNIDYRKEPPMFKITETHYAATWLLHERAPKIDMPQELKDKINREKKENNNDAI